MFASRALAVVIVSALLSGCATVGPVPATPGRGLSAADATRDRTACETEAGAYAETGVAEFFKTKIAWTVGGAVAGIMLGAAAVAEQSYSDPRQPLIVIAAFGAVGGAIGFVAGDVAGLKRGIDARRGAQHSAEVAYRECLRKRGWDVR